jgi:hypothetical protein
MRLITVSTLIVSLALGAGVAAQDSLAWLVGTWLEQIQSKGGVKDRSPKLLQVVVADGILRVIEGGQDGDDIRCRLDGTETRSTQVKSKATLEYILKCKANSQSLEIRGRSIASGMSGIPPQQFEVEKNYERAKDGSLRERFRLRPLVQGIGSIDLVDERTNFARSQ